MFGRRSHQRVTLSVPTEGTLRISRDVLVERATPEELVVISRHAGVVGENLKVAEVEAGREAFVARVAESHPLVADGSVRHRIRLRTTHAPQRYENRR